MKYLCIYWGREIEEKLRDSSLGGLGSCSTVVQVVPQGCGVISHDTSGSQAKGHFKI